ncbi:MAG: hypothetical protein LBV09_02440 [Deferribacteraceae bacterium]|jgi:lipopolysaccharide export system protein LptA|nr:hypothetical protein [Deferribacteraceae bacterium]
MFRRVFSIVSIAVFASLLLYMNLTGEEELQMPSVMIPQNHISMEGVTFLRGFGVDGGYITVTAQNAYLDQNSNTITLHDTDMVLKDGKNDLVAYSERGLYVINRSLSTSGNVHGVWNELTYTVGEGGTFNYDFLTQKSVMGDNVTFTTDTSYIKSTRMDYDGATQMMIFSGDVEMFLAGDTLK